MLTKYRIYGMDAYERVIDDSLVKHHLGEFKLALQVILTEAMNNAYRHGNKEDATKPIDVIVNTVKCNNGRGLQICVQDTGEGFSMQRKVKELGTTLLDENGRGLFLIKQFADTVSVNDNKICIYKYIEEDSK